MAPTVCCHVAIPFAKHMATGVVATWQLRFNVLGNCSCCHMATTIHYTWQLELFPHGNSLFCTYSSHYVPFFTITCLFPCILTRCLILAATPEEISPSLDEAYRRIEEAALQRRSSRGQGQSSSNVPAESVSEDTIRSATPSSVRQQRVVHPPPADD